MLLAILFGACAIVVSDTLDQRYGTAAVQNRLADQVSSATTEYYRDAKPILDKRCVACHACADAPCQLQLGSFEGIDRGASPELVYDASRLLAADPSRLFTDASSTAQWRDRSFFPVLNERIQSVTNNLQASVLYRMLDLKRKNPHDGSALLPDSLITGTATGHVCAPFAQFDAFAEKHAQHGMPYGLPAVSDTEFQTLTNWLRDGAKTAQPAKLTQDTRDQVFWWEAFLNQSSLKSQLMSRYLYEHLFLANLYFGNADDDFNGPYFRLVRSRTPPGEPVSIIATRRPYEDPGSDRFYYRLCHDRSTIVAKTHMPYALNQARMSRWQKLFLLNRSKVTKLPSYETSVAANPFKAFKDIPVDSRYRFLLDEAQFSIMNFIKGPVCRGQVALNVINDRFWVFFVNPDNRSFRRGSRLLNSSAEFLRMPNEEGSNASPLSVWTKYAELQKERTRSGEAFLKKEFSKLGKISMNLIWSGRGNDNAALTVFRHADNATVVKGLVGEQPKTAWVLSYSLMERIHYLLVAGYDVYGNIGHNLNSRLYMDFLRMEGESSFLAFLPRNARLKERDHWYRYAQLEVEDYIRFGSKYFNAPTAIRYRTRQPKKELFDKLSRRLRRSLNRSHDLRASGLGPESVNALRRLASITGSAVSQLPEFSYLTVTDRASSHTVSLIRNTALANVAYLFNESSRRLPEEDTLTVAAGFTGTYPNAFFRVNASELNEFVAAVRGLAEPGAYDRLASRFGVRRTSPDFWAHSDRVHQHFKARQPLEYGVLDYNRLENR